MAVRLSTIAAAASVAACAFGVGAYAIAMRPDLTQGARFLFFDEGHNLLVSSVVASGGHAYSDVFTPYGPLTAWTALIAARIGGNTPVTYDALLLALNTVALSLVFLAIRRHSSAVWAALLTVIAALPAMLAPGSMLGGSAESPYMALERVLFAALLLLWGHPDRRPVSRSLLLGVVAGLCQWIRFGNVILAIAGIVAADLTAASARGERKLLIRQLACVALGAVGAELALAAWAFATLPALVAQDVLWPAYFVPSYSWVTPELRWPSFSIALVVAQYGGALAGLVIGPIVWWRYRKSPTAPLIAFLLCAYVLGAVGLFRHAYHFRQYGWWLVVAGALAAAATTARVRVAVVILSAGVFVTMLRALGEAPRPGEWVQTSASGAVYLSAETAETVRALNALADDAESRGSNITVGPLASGWYSLFAHRPPTRHTWFLSAVVRPWEQEAVTNALLASSAIVVCDTNRALTALNLSDDITAKLAARFNRHHALGAGCEAFVPE